MTPYYRGHGDRRKCRRICFVALFQLAVVSQFKKLNFDLYIYIYFEGLGHFRLDLFTIWFAVRLRRDVGRTSTEAIGF